MKTKQSFLQGVLLSSILLLILTLGIEGDLIIKAFNNTNQQASLIRSIGTQNIYNISPSKNVPGTFNFNYVYAKSSINSKKEAQFDFPIIPFDEEKARAALEKEYGYVDFGPTRDAWGYPVRENAFMKSPQRPEETRRQSLNPFKIQKAEGYDPDTNTPGLYNCRANTSVTGYFKAYFEDVALQNNIGFNHPTYGNTRREEACQVLQDMSELLMMDEAAVTPDILFMRSDTPMPLDALAGASSYFGSNYSTNSLDNGALHKHIISRQDPTPAVGFFDAFVIINWSASWSVDSTLNSNTYDFNTVINHELMHALGFLSTVPPVVPDILETNNEFIGIHLHNTFNLNLYKDDSLLNLFVNPITKMLDVQAGAPSPWFTTDEVVYRGQNNHTNSTPDGIRPIYSPLPWEPGSSLSHFDMGRANGEVYLMHPSIDTNAEIDIHGHEVQVLCHLGYQVAGECSQKTPLAVNDLQILDETNPVCINLLQNDISFDIVLQILRVNTFEPVSIQSGDVIEYFQSTNCLSSTMQATPLNARSVRITPTNNPSPRVFEYTNKIGVSNSRISSPAKVHVIPSCENISNPSEYVCNGDFEMDFIFSPGTVTDYPTPATSVSYNGALGCDEWSPVWKVFYWCRSFGTPDIRSLTPDGSNYSIAVRSTQASSEGALTKLVNPLTVGEEYELSMWVYPLQQNAAVSEISIFAQLNSGQGNILSGQASAISQINTFSEFDYSIISGMSIPLNTWTYVTQTFVAESDYDFLRLYGYVTDGVGYGYTYFDGISIRLAGGENPFDCQEGRSKFIIEDDIVGCSIRGTVYQDLNQNSSWEQLTEPGLSGIQVNLFEAGNPTPIQTTTTEDLPNPGKYQFTNLPDGTYYIVLSNEGLFPSVTEPASNNIFPNYSHARLVNISNGQMVENQNLGVTLTGDVGLVYGCTDSSASNYNSNANTDDGSCEQYPIIKGIVYYDANQNSSLDPQENKVPNAEVGLFEPGVSTPVSTTYTNNQGQYQFINFIAGNYHIALIDEQGYPIITQPEYNDNLISGYQYPYSVNAQGGGVYYMDFGISGKADISTRKSLLDSTLTLLDRQITWRVVVSNNGTNEATNVIIEDILPEGLVYVSHTTSDPTTTYNPATGIYTIPVLNLTEQPILDITMRVPLNICGIKTNTARLISLDQADMDSENNEYSSSINITSCLGVASSIKRF